MPNKGKPSIRNSIDMSFRISVGNLKNAGIIRVNPCTAYGFLDHSLKEDCATIQSQLKGVSDGETKKIHP